jgi:hypothetical protein
LGAVGLTAPNPFISVTVYHFHFITQRLVSDRFSLLQIVNPEVGWASELRNFHMIRYSLLGISSDLLRLRFCRALLSLLSSSARNNSRTPERISMKFDI